MTLHGKVGFKLAKRKIRLHYDDAAIQEKKMEKNGIKIERFCVVRFGCCSFFLLGFLSAVPLGLGWRLSSLRALL